MALILTRRAARRLYEGKPGKLCILNLQTGQVEQLTNGDENISSPTYTPDGNSIVFSRETRSRWGGLSPAWNERGALVILNLQSQTRRVLVSETLQASKAFFRANGDMVWQDQRGICVAALERADRPYIMGPAYGVAYSHDGNKFVNIADAMGLVYVENLEDKSKEQVYGVGSAKQVKFLPNEDVLVLTEETRGGAPKCNLYRARPGQTSYRRTLVSESGFSAPSEGITASPKFDWRHSLR